MKTDRGAAKRIKSPARAGCAGARPSARTCSRRSRASGRAGSAAETDIAKVDERQVRRMLGR